MDLKKDKQARYLPQLSLGVRYICILPELLLSFSGDSLS
jgi:hypothetical protein